MGISVQTLWVLVFRGVNDLPEGSFRRNDPSLTNRIPNGSNGSTKTAACSGWEEPLGEDSFWFLVSAISSAMERPSLLSPLNGDEKRLTTVPQRTVSLLSETDAKQASVQLLKRQALGVWHADALSDVENAIGDLHFWPTTWSKDPRSRDYDMQRLGRSKRLDNRERFELFRFVVGNGASPALAVELLAASESLPDTFAITQMENLVKKAAEGSFSKYKAYIMADRKWAPVFCVPEQKPLPLGEYCPYEDARKVLARQKKRQ